MRALCCAPAGTARAAFGGRQRRIARSGITTECDHAGVACRGVASTSPITARKGVACTVVIFYAAPVLRWRPLPRPAGQQPTRRWPSRPLRSRRRHRVPRLRRSRRCRHWHRCAPRSIASSPSTGVRARSARRGRASKPSASAARRWCTTTGMAAAGGRSPGARPNRRCGWCMQPTLPRANWR